MTRMIPVLATALLIMLCVGCQKTEKAPDTAQYQDTVAPPPPPEQAVSKNLKANRPEAARPGKTKAAMANARPELPPAVISVRDHADMVLIPAGPFVYGLGERARDSVIDALSTAHLAIFNLEFERHTVELPSFYMDKYEVTNAHYAVFMKETGHRKPKYWTSRLYSRPNQPVVGIGWDDAQAYAAWAGKRLPSEEEWEKAARGTDGRIWPWGNEPSSDKYNGSMQGNYAPVEVGSFPQGASPYGVMDMAGNVYEMTTGKWGSTGRAMRGGSYLNAGAYTRTMFRWAPDDDTSGAAWLGFRCVMDTNVAGTMARPPGRED